MFDEHQDRSSRRRKREKISRGGPRIKDTNNTVQPRISDDIIVDDIFRLRQEIARSNGRFLCTCGTEFPEILTNCPNCDKSI